MSSASPRHSDAEDDDEEPRRSASRASTLGSQRQAQPTQRRVSFDIPSSEEEIPSERPADLASEFWCRPRAYAFDFTDPQAFRMEEETPSSSSSEEAEESLVAVLRTETRGYQRPRAFGFGNEAELARFANCYVRVSASAIDQLPLFRFGELNSSSAIASSSSSAAEDIVTHECAICLTAYAKGDLIRRCPCLHMFHARCIEAWLECGSFGAKCCPVCKSPTVE
eukprot:TRINITY_DN33746_c0_g1_i1.p2 TRINITY_DN33746_c0_g1~~TRINITY_DN33746_c0_g1_i1.p2  ORF type:complete len:224 (-),score=31.09 TRINITY_DN33746_c0_g1_i1:138-809(-)